MKILLQCLLLLSFNTSGVFAEILAFKIPISLITTEGKGSPNLQRLEKPPEASPFFGKADELWTASSFMPQQEQVSEKLDWVVWNATSGRLVAKGSWSALFELHDYYRLNSSVVQCRLKVDVYDVPTDGSPPDPSKPPAHSLNFVTRSGQTAKASNVEGESSIQFEGEVNIGEDFNLIDLRIAASVSLAKFAIEDIQTSVALNDNTPLWIARDSDGKQGIDLLITASIELTDGTPFRDLIMRQEDNVMKPYSPSTMHKRSGDIVIGEGRRLVWSKFPFDYLRLLYGERSTDVEEDPFAPQKPVHLDGKKLKEVQALEIFSPHFYGKVIDIRDALKLNGIKVSDQDFAGYDPKTKCVFMYSSEAGELDKFQQLVIIYECSHVSSLAITSRGDGEMRLMSRSGMKSLLVGRAFKSNHSRSIEIEPNIGENNTIIDLRYFYSEKVGEKVIHSLESSSSLEAGKFLKVFEKEQVDGSKKSMELKAELLETAH